MRIGGFWSAVIGFAGSPTGHVNAGASIAAGLLFSLAKAPVSIGTRNQAPDFTEVSKL